MQININRISDMYSDIPLPSYATEGSAGMDIYAAIERPLSINPGETVMVPSGISIQLDQGFECQVRSRSGLAAKYGIFALNAPGTVDSDYRGEIKVILSNFGSEKFVVNRGDRIAQLVIARYERIIWNEVSELDSTERGAGGFGSTGISK